MRKWALLVVALFGTAAPGYAQETVILEPGEAVRVEAAPIVLPPPEPPETVYVPVPTPPDTVYECPPGWTCQRPPPDVVLPTYELHLTADRSGSGVVVDGAEIPPGDYYIHLERSDDSWRGLGEVEAPGVDSVVFTVDGSRNRERLYPYEAPAGNTPVSIAGSHLITWRVFGDEPAAASVSVTAIDDVPPPVDTEAKLERIFGVPRADRIAPTYDSIYAHWGDVHWDRNGTQWEYYYYDRGLGWYAAWWRGKGEHYLDRAAGAVDAYLNDYVNGITNDGSPRNGRIPPRWSFVEGLAVDYLVRGTPLALDMIEAIAVRLDAIWMDNFFTTPYQDGRIQGRTVMAQLIAYEMTGKQVYRDNLQTGIENLITWYGQESSGFWPMRSYCYAQANFQASHAILDVLIRHYDLVEQDPRIPPIVKASLDEMWKYWHAGVGFEYMSDPHSDPCLNDQGNTVGNTDPAPDVSLLILPAFDWYYAYSGQNRYRQRAAEIYSTGLARTYWNGHKQFNQSFMRSWRHPEVLGN